MRVQPGRWSKHLVPSQSNLVPSPSLQIEDDQIQHRSTGAQREAVSELNDVVQTLGQVAEVGFGVPDLWVDGGLQAHRSTTSTSPAGSQLCGLECLSEAPLTKTAFDDVSLTAIGILNDTPGAKEGMRHHWAIPWKFRPSSRSDNWGLGSRVRR